VKEKSNTLISRAFSGRKRVCPAMTLLVDDLLEIPVQFFQVIFNAIVQTAYKSTWADYRRQLNISLIKLRREYEEGRVTKEEMQKIEARIFSELRLANRVLSA
jgi:hypothetical protein